VSGTKRKVRVACVQMDVVYGDVAGTVARVSQFVEKAGEQGADVVLFPELILSAGYALGERYRKVAETVPGPSLDNIAKLAAERKLYVIVGLAEKTDSGMLYDSAVMFDRKGRILGKYRKSHIYPATESIFTRGQELPVFQTDFGTVGLLICYDLEFPETARIMALQGAEIIFHLVADWPQGVPGLPERIFDLSFRARALENRIVLAICNRVGNDPDLRSYFYGLSRIIGTQGEIIASADQGEKMILADVDLEQASREREAYNYFHDRRPELYNILLEQNRPGPK
jgi:predicted amidohydrolase